MNGSNDTTRHVSDQIVPAFLTAQPQQTQVNTGFPTGNEGILELNLLWAGTFNTSSAAGAVVTDGALKLLRSINLRTDKHGDIIRNVDGLGMHRMLHLSHETRGPVEDCASTADGTTFSAALRIPFADQDRLLRPYDSLIDMGMNPVMTLKTQYGVVTDVQSAGTAGTVNGLRQDVDVEVLPGLERGSERPETPNWVPVWEKLAPVAASAGVARIPIPTGDRVIRRIHFMQATIDATTGRLTEVSSIIPNTAKIFFKIGSTVIVEPTSFRALNYKNKHDARVETMPAGWFFLGFDRQKSVPRMLDLYQFPSGLTCEVQIDSVNTVSNGFVIPYIEYFQMIPKAAGGKI